jgi:hypothetical protein
MHDAWTDAAGEERTMSSDEQSVVVPVTVGSFCRAETDMYFALFAEKGDFGHPSNHWCL